MSSPGTASPPPLLPRISDYVAWHAARHPDAVALVIEGLVITYAKLATEIDRLARALLAAGVKKGDRVATLQTPHPDFVTAWLATASIGAIWVGLNPRYQASELAYIVKDAAPKILLTRTDIGGRNYFAEIAALVSSTPSLERAVSFSAQPQTEGIEPMERFLSLGDCVPTYGLASAREGCGGRDPCVIVYTSGSTGKPKGALLHHEGIGEFGIAQNEVWPVNPHRILNFLPINHIGCLCDVTMPCLIAGGTMHCMEQFDPAKATVMIERARLTIWGSVPSVFALQMATPEYATTDLSSIQLILWEGASMPLTMISELLEVGAPMATNYGMTESVSGITLVEPTRDSDVLAHSVGAAFPGVEIRLLDTDGNEVSDGELGEVTFKSRYCFSGYWRRPEATADSFTAEGFFKTGDLAVRRRDGRYCIVGRLKEMYKSGGYNVYPREVEAVLEEHPAIQLAAVVSRTDPVWQEVGIAYVNAIEDVTPAELDSWCRGRLANYKIPKRIFIEPNMPLLPIGKIDKIALKERAAAL